MSIFPSYVPITSCSPCVFECYDELRDKRVIIKRKKLNSSKISLEHDIISNIKDNTYFPKLEDAFITQNIQNKLVENLVLTYMPKTLTSYINEFKIKKQHIPIENIKTITKQLLKALEILHDNKIIHRNLTPDNILINDNDGEIHLELCGFAKARISDGSEMDLKITSPGYSAPELLLAATFYSYEVDIFSAGCIIAELFKLGKLFKGNMNIFEIFALIGYPNKEYFSKFNIADCYKTYLESVEMKKEDIKNVINYDKFYDNREIEKAEKLLSGMLNYDVNERFTAEQALKSDFILE